MARIGSCGSAAATKSESPRDMAPIFEQKRPGAGLEHPPWAFWQPHGAYTARTPTPYKVRTQNDSSGRPIA